MRSSIAASPFAPAPASIAARAEAKRATTTAKSGPIGGWVALGPANVGGRIRAIAIDPVDRNLIWIGAPGGGIWHSEDAGASWTPADDMLASMVISCIVIDPVSRETLYACTGENFNSISPIRGNGILKSTDRGRTWTLLPSTDPAIGGAGFHYVSNIAIHPTDSRLLLAACGDGVYRSLDYGATWTRTYVPSAFGHAQLMGAVRFDPNDPRNAIAGGFNGQVAFTRDSGATWSERTLIPFTGFFPRIEPAYAPSVREMLYASADDLGATAPGANPGRVFESRDGGDSWTEISRPGHLLSQGGYSNMLWVDPQDAKHVLVGGYTLWRSFDSGRTFTMVTMPSVSLHADHHIVVAEPGYDRWRPGSRAVLLGTDGGIYRALDIVTATGADADWVNLNKGLEIGQLYSGGGGDGRITGGLQDVGHITWFPSLGRWRTFSGGSYMTPARTRFTMDPDRLFAGDSGAVAVDPRRPKYMYFASIYLNLGRSFDGGDTTHAICGGIPETACGGGLLETNFTSPIMLDPSDPSRLYAGAASLWVTTNARESDPDLVRWSQVKARDAGYSGWNNINAIGVSPVDPAIVWVGYNGGGLAVTTNALDAAPRWRTITASLPLARPVSSIVPDATDANTAYVTWGNSWPDQGFAPGNLQRTSDLGATWTDLSVGLPPLPINTVVQRPGTPWLWVGTTNGAFMSRDGGASWTVSTIGPANTAVSQLFWLTPTTLAAATYGRGFFSLEVP